jgi:hypothetical protein
MVSALLVVDVGVGSDPTNDFAGLIAQGRAPRIEPTVLAICPPYPEFRMECAA